MPPFTTVKAEKPSGKNFIKVSTHEIPQETRRTRHTEKPSDVSDDEDVAEDTKFSTKDIAEAYAYHEMLRDILNGDDPRTWSDSSYSDSLDEDSDDEESEDEDQKDESTDEKKDGEDDDDDDKPNIQLYLIQRDDELTLPSFRGGCSNVRLRDNMWISDPELKMGPNMGFLTRLGHVCIEAKTRDCTNPMCEDKLKLIEKIAPTCDWKPFWRWALVSMSCQAAMTPSQKLTRAHTHIARSVSACSSILRLFLDDKRILDDTLDGPPHEGDSLSDKIDISGVCNIIYWMMSIQKSIGTGSTNFGRWNHKLLPYNVTIPSIADAMERLDKLKICKNRLWSLVNLSQRKEADLPDIITVLEGSANMLRHKDHDTCTPSKCQYTYINTTKLKQLHKCKNEDCPQDKYPVDTLATALELGNKTAWLCSKPRLCGSEDSYLAISHVWSDGTGVGMKTSGTINKCLFTYFADIAKRLDCAGLWWDTLSIPTEPQARSKALNQMHANYKNAKYTVVHDRYLLNMKWKDDGSPCVAIVLSPWFTRGWTALELAMSKKVRVLFKGEKDGVPVIKDLDRHILAKDPSTCSRAHWLASTLIRRLRQPVDNLTDLLAILKPRFTSWARDRTEIAGLLAGVPGCDYTRVESEITMDILRYFGRVPYSCLMHGKPTMYDIGGFSWCAATLDDMEVDLSTEMEGGTENNKEGLLEIDHEGVVKGDWYYRRVTQKDVDRLLPVASDLATQVKVHVALQNWETCVLLSEEEPEDNKHGHRALLAITLGTKSWEWVDCRYVGVVNILPHRKMKHADVDSDSNKHIEQRKEGEDEEEEEEDEDEDKEEWEFEVFRIGKDKGKSAMSTKKTFKIVTALLDVSDGEPDGDDGGESDDNNSEDSKDVAMLNVAESSVAEGPRSRRITSQREETSWWRSIPGIVGYRRPQTLDEREYITDRSLSTQMEKSADQLLYAVRASEGDVVRHLIKNKVDLTYDTKVNIVSILGSKRYPKRCALLGDVYRENWRLEDAEYMYRHAENGFVENREGLSTSILQVKQDLGNVYTELNKIEEAETLFKDMVDICEKRRRRKQEKKKKTAEKKAQEQAKPGVKPGAEGNAPHAQHAQHGASGAKGPAEKEGGQGSNRRISESERLEATAFASLCLLYANQGKLLDAAREYKRALKAFGKDLPDLPGAFTYDWSNYASEPYQKRKERNELSEDMYQLVLKKFRSDLGAEHLLTLTTALNLGINYGQQRKKAEAQELLNEALEGFKKVFGKDYVSRRGSEHIMTLCCQNQLAALLTADEKLDEAAPMLHQSLSGLSAKFGSEHPLTLLTTASMGLYSLYRGDLKRAEKMFTTAKSGFEKIKDIGPRHRFTLNAIRSLGTVYAQGGNVDAAQKMFQKALNSLRRSNAPHDIDVCKVKMNLGMLQGSQGQLEEAKKAMQASLAGFEALLGPDAVETLGAADALGRVNDKLGVVEDARENMQRALTGFEKVLGAYNRRTLDTAEYLGIFYARQRKQNLAEENFLRAHKGYERTLEPTNKKIFESAFWLGLIYRDQWKWNSAEKMLKKAQEGLDKISGHDLTPRILTALGEVYEATSKRSDAENMYKLAAENYENAVGPEDYLTLAAKLKLGDLYVEKRNQEGAEDIIREVLETSNRVFSDHDPRRYYPILSQGRLRHKQNRLDEAEVLLYEAVHGFDSYAAEDDIGKFNAGASLGYLMADQHRQEEAAELIKTALSGYEKLEHPSMIITMNRLSQIYTDLDKDVENEKIKKTLRAAYEKAFGPEVTDHLMNATAKDRLRSKPAPPDHFQDYDSDDSDDSSEESDWDPYETSLSRRGTTNWTSNSQADGQPREANPAHAIEIPANSWDYNPRTVEEYDMQVARSVLGFPEASIRRILERLTDKVTCRACGTRFKSRNELFRHLEREGHETAQIHPEAMQSLGFDSQYSSTYQMLQNMSIYEHDHERNINKVYRNVEKRPFAWHEFDISPALMLINDGINVVVQGSNSGPWRGVARANHFMPVNQGVYYFEVTILQSGPSKIIGVGFCEGRAPLHRMLGWDRGSWGYHGDDGKIFESGEHVSSFGPTYDTGDVVGCGVNFDTGTAFFTINGHLIGRAFRRVGGKLYPAVCFDTQMINAHISVNFGDSPFVFTGSLTDPTTFRGI